MGSRVVYIDIIKGILLLLICLSHFGNIPGYLSPIIGLTPMYYVPFFFFISGYLFKTNISFKDHLVKKVRTLLIQYLFFSLSFVILDWNTYLDFESICDQFINIFIWGKGAFKASPLYFVNLLFSTSIISFYIIKISNIKYQISNIKYQISNIIILSIVALLMSNNSIKLPLMLEVVPSAIVYMVLGSMFFRYKSALERNNLITLLITFFIGIIGILFIRLGDFHLNEIVSYPLFYISPIAFSIFIMLLFAKIPNDKLLIAKPITYIAKNGIIILSTHCYFIIIFNKICEVLQIQDGWYLFYVKLIFVYLALVIIIPILNKRCSWLLGYNKQ